jgi:hypothetical protein
MEEASFGVVGLFIVLAWRGEVGKECELIGGIDLDGDLGCSGTLARLDCTG